MPRISRGKRLTGQAPVKSDMPFHICENLTGQALLTYESMVRVPTEITRENWEMEQLKNLFFSSMK